MRHSDAVKQNQWATVTHIVVVPARLVVGTEEATTVIWRFDSRFHFYSTSVALMLIVSETVDGNRDDLLPFAAARSYTTWSRNAIPRGSIALINSSAIMSDEFLNR